MVELVLKYSGYWKCIFMKNGRKYECGSHKTIMEVADELALNYLADILEEFHQVACGQLTLWNSSPSSLKELLRIC